TMRWTLRLTVPLALFAGVIYLGSESWKRSVECYWLAKADDAPPYSAPQTAAYRKAFGADGKNFETAYQIGEILRMQSWQGGDDYRELAQQAMQWFQTSMALNPY